MNLKIIKDISGEVSNPTLLAGWPGMGSVGVGAINYMRRQLGAVPFAEMDMNEYFSPESVVVEDGISNFPDLPSHVFYTVPGKDVLIFESEAQLPGQGGISMMNQILDLSEGLHVRSIYTGAAFAVPISHTERVQVLGVSNRESLRDSLIPHGVEVLKQGQISGLNGLLLGFAGARDIPAACLLATMPHYFIQMPNPKASREVVKVLLSILEMEVDMEEMDEAVDQMEKVLSEIEDKIRTAFSSMEEADIEEPEFEEVDEEQVPQYVMDKIARMFLQVRQAPEGTRSEELAAFLKNELDKWGLYSIYEDRFLDLFRREP